MAQKTNHQNQMQEEEARETGLSKQIFQVDLHWQKTLLHFRKQQQDDNFCIHVYWNCFIRL